ncbi:MAG: hypothetical protein ABW195_03125 [Ilumatobacteraceae bacterium]
MDRAPLPPHERPWRHPSELGPIAEHEPTTTGGKALIVTSATLGLLLVGVLAVAMTPDHSSSPEAVASTISGLRQVPASAEALEQPELPLVTPLGDDGWAVTTMSALAGRSGSVTARLPSGAEVQAEIITTDRSTGLTVVSVPALAGYELAADEPAPTDTVYVHGDPPQTVTITELASLDVAEATPVLDADGDLIGLCTQEADGVALRTVSTMPTDDRETTVPPARPSTAPTATPAPTVAPTTVPSIPGPTATTVPAPTTVTNAPTTTSPPTTGVPSTTTPIGGTVGPSAGGQVSGAGAPTTAPR